MSYNGWKNIMIRVNILITTYNLEKYIAKCLESVLQQKTSFDYKIIVSDDASTDKTSEILMKYKEEYPKKIELILRDKNVGSLANSIGLYEKCDTEYFAFLDGDDYWITDDRLQKQVDFLDANSKYVICGGNTRYLYENSLDRRKTVIPKKYLGKKYSIDDFYSQKVPFVHTSSILFRNVVFRNGVPDIYYKVLGTYEECALRGEDFRFLLHLNYGNMYIMKEGYSIYRIHKGGIWQGSSEIIRELESVIYYNFNKKIWKEHSEFFLGLRNRAYIKLMNTLIKDKRFIKEYRLNDKEHLYYSHLINDLKNENRDGSII